MKVQVAVKSPLTRFRRWGHTFGREPGEYELSDEQVERIQSGPESTALAIVATKAPATKRRAKPEKPARSESAAKSDKKKSPKSEE